MGLQPPHAITYEEFLAFPEDGIRRELIDGEVHVTPAPTTRHQQLALGIACLFLDHVEEKGGGSVLIARCEVLLPGERSVQPDVIFISQRSAGLITRPRIDGVPELLVEVLSDPRMDRRIKKDLYGACGVKEYWIVDPDPNVPMWWRFSGSGRAVVTGSPRSLPRTG